VHSAHLYHKSQEFLGVTQAARAAWLSEPWAAGTQMPTGSIK
jgi:hypothetical protein